MKNHLLCFNINNIEIDSILGTNGYVWIYKNDPSILEALNDKELTFGKFFFVFFSKFNKINDIFSSYFYLRLPSFFSICLIFYMQNI